MNENTWLVSFQCEINAAGIAQLQHFCHRLKAWVRDTYGEQALLDIVPSYQTVMVSFRLNIIDPLQCEQAIEHTLRQQGQTASAPSNRQITLPVFYGAQVGPDLPHLSQSHQLSVEQVIKLHCEQVYRVYAIGFSPGFPYLAEVNPSIATPRLRQARSKVPAGSVGIADNQTGIYPNASPGGWQIIGNCPTPLFDEHWQSLLQVGDEVQFEPIDQARFIKMGGQINEF
ncbi:5-oxoprolinase subunit PxpB [Motilimonas pumila]|uniref:5-oxoprolinase subunit PxpB n=1 Tax=Motilimonas pumila TaxID=2303987 RepID=UPI001314A857|nr:5-oxoprolinase subunit PxpB [Motilimonas pumila]